jgi:hypothetical protein
MPAVVPVTPATETIVHAGEATVQSMVKSAGVKPTDVKRSGAKPTSVKPATTVKPAATVESSASTMRSVGEVWLEERSNAQHGSCGAYKSPSDPGPGAIFG